MITTSAVDNCSLDTSLCDGALFDTGASFCLFLLTMAVDDIFVDVFSIDYGCLFLDMLLETDGLSHVRLRAFSSHS